MRTETLAIVFTDIKGYTAATSAQTHQENARMLRRTERLVEPVVRAYSGQVIKSIGDAYMIVFRSPTEAVRCATAIQDRLFQHNASSRPDDTIHIRIAMNIGEVRVHRGDVFGEPVNIAARIESITPADEIYFSEAVYLTMNKNELPCERVGEFELKGIPEPVAVFRMRKFAHNEGEEATTKKGALPFAGTQLGHWRRMRWVRRAYFMLWALAVSGLLGAAYLRYRPSADYTEVLTAMKVAVENGKPMEVLALHGQIPLGATQERQLARRYRKQAANMLLAQGDTEAAMSEVNALVKEDDRDPEALLLQGVLLSKTGKSTKQAMAALAAAFKLNSSLGAERNDVIQAVVAAYRDPDARRVADSIVEEYLKQSAVPQLARTLKDPTFERSGRIHVALRLERLGASEEVDWVAIALEDLKSTSCKTRKNAIARLVNESDERAVGPLMKVASAGGCGAAQARRAADAILGR